MSQDRSAIDTITGYYYQFDKTIIQILSCENLADIVTVEGIEDIDVATGGGISAIQCKYYAKTEYNHSVIAKAIRLMLKDFAKNIDNRDSFKYKIFGHYKSGHQKLTLPISIDFLKQKFLTYTESGVKHELHQELELTDEQLQKFIISLDIDINADDFLTQEHKSIHMLKEIFSCKEFEAEYYFYNNALREIRRLATLQNIEDRCITKQEFISNINNKNNLFDIWYLEYRGVNEYAKMIKKNFFTNLNISPYERFFLIECDNYISELEIKSLILKISKKWSKLSKKEPKPFCPYIYLHGISDVSIINIKKSLQEDDVLFIDGYDFKGAEFSSKSILRKGSYHNGIQFKFLTELEQFYKTVNEAQGVKKIFEFHLDTPFYENTEKDITFIKINKSNDINQMI